MTSWIKTSLLTMGLLWVDTLQIYSQNVIDNGTQNREHSTIILFRTFDVFSFDRSYKLYASDSLLGRIKTKDVIIVDTYDKGISFPVTTKAPSLHANKRSIKLSKTEKDKVHNYSKVWTSLLCKMWIFDSKPF